MITVQFSSFDYNFKRCLLFPRYDGPFLHITMVFCCIYGNSFVCSLPFSRSFLQFLWCALNFPLDAYCTRYRSELMKPSKLYDGKICPFSLRKSYNVNSDLQGYSTIFLNLTDFRASCLYMCSIPCTCNC